jgi:hypothetical protein
MTSVCAHMNLGPFFNVYQRFDCVSDAITSFKIALIKHYGVLDKSIGEIRGPDEMPCVDLYPQCVDCSRYENHHDYPMARYQVGPRGGIRKVSI